MGTDYWSVSQLNQYLGCSLQYYLQRIEGLAPQHVTSQSILGRGVHNALSIACMRRKQGKRMAKKELADAFAAELKAEVKLTDVPIQYKDGEGLDSTLAQGLALVECWADHAPEDDVVSVEQRFEVELINSDGVVLSKPLVGYLDLIVRENGGFAIVDFKTLSRRMSAAQIETDMQATGYLYALGQLHGPGAFRFDVLVKNKTPKFEQYRTARTTEDFDRFIRIVQTVEMGVVAGIFLPNERGFYCANCGYKQACKEWHRTAARTTVGVGGVVT